MLTLLAFSGGWDTCQPVTEKDLATSEARNLTREYLNEIDPDLVVVSPPCLQEGRAVNTTPNEYRRWCQKKADHRTFFFTEEIVHWQADRGRSVLAEIIPTDKAQPPMVTVCNRGDINEVRTTDGKRWAGTKHICQKMSEAERDGEDTKERTILESAQETMDKDMLVCCPVAVDQENGDVQEERFMMPGEDISMNWSDNEIPTEQREDLLRKVLKAIRRTHNGLGHPARTTLLRMMKLGNASPAAMAYARAWQRPVCQASARPHKPQEASTRLRPFGFNKTVVMDLKSLKDADKKNHVASSMFDAGTSWHVAILLENRKPKHVTG